MANIYIQISAGRGPQECSRVVAKLLPILLKEAEAQMLEVTVMEKVNGNINGTLQSVLLRLAGENPDAFAAGWQGTVQWIAQSPYRRFHKRKNWFVSIQCFRPGRKQVISEKEIIYITCRSGGPGGQHVNKTETAVRATHSPSGLSVVASGSRSQHQNRKEATGRLLEKLSLWEAAQQLQLAQEQWQQHNDTERGNAIKVFNDRL